MNPRTANLLLGAMILAGLSACTTTPPTVQTGPDAEVTFDGLTKVDHTAMDAVWVRPDLDLTGYNKILLAGAGIEYRPTRGPESNSTTTRMTSPTDTEFAISEEGKQRLRETVGQAFRDELSESEQFEIVTEPGRDVLVVVGALLDVVSNVPPQNLGRGGIYLSQVGAATLVIELRDSMSGAILLRAVDRDAAEPMSDFMEINSVTGWNEVRRLANGWARRLRDGLETMMSQPATS